MVLVVYAPSYFLGFFGDIALVACCCFSNFSFGEEFAYLIVCSIWLYRWRDVYLFMISFDFACLVLPFIGFSGICLLSLLIPFALLLTCISGDVCFSLIYLNCCFWLWRFLWRLQCYRSMLLVKLLIKYISWELRPLPEYFIQNIHSSCPQLRITIKRKILKFLLNCFSLWKCILTQDRFIILENVRIALLPLVYSE